MLRWFWFRHLICSCPAVLCPLKMQLCRLNYWIKQRAKKYVHFYSFRSWDLEINIFSVFKPALNLKKGACIRMLRWFWFRHLICSCPAVLCPLKMQLCRLNYWIKQRAKNAGLIYIPMCRCYLSELLDVSSPSILNTL